MMIGAAGLALAAASATPRQPAIPPVSNNNNAARLARAQAEIRAARNNVARFDRAAREATRASDRATLEAALLAAQVQEEEALLAAAREKVSVLAARRQALSRRLARERAPVTRLVAGLETIARRPPLLTLAQPGSIEDAVHLRAVIAAVVPQIRQKTETLRRDVAHAHDLEAAAVAAVADRRAAQARLLDRRKQLATLADRRLLEARRATGAADREAERAFLAAEQARDLDTLVSRIDTARPAATPGATPAPGPADYRLPVAGRVVARDQASAAGLSILATPGAQVVSPAAGRVGFAGAYRGYGSIVIVEHGDGWTSLVTGLGTLQTRVGQAVVAGSPIGLAPGGQAAVGLELRRAGRTVDPLALLRSAPR